MACGDRNRLPDIILIAWHDDHARHFFVDAGVGGIHAETDGVRKDIALNHTRELFDQVCHVSTLPAIAALSPCS